MKCALCGGKHTAWSGACPRRKAILTKISAAKKELLMHPYFPERVTITPGVSGRVTRDTSDNGRQPRPDTAEVSEVDMEVDETIGDNRAGEPEEPSGPSHTNTTAFDFTPNSSSMEASIYNFTAQEVPHTPSTRIFVDRVEASSPIQQSTQTAMAVPKSVRYPGTRKRKTAPLLNTTRTPLGDISVNRGDTTFTMDTRGTKTVFGSDTESMDVEMTQGEPKRACCDGAR
jgi:hypothetical protein